MTTTFSMPDASAIPFTALPRPKISGREVVLNYKTPRTGITFNPIKQMLAALDNSGRKKFVRGYYQDCGRFAGYMQAEPIPEDMMGRIIGIWRSRDFMCTAWPSDHPPILARLTINRCAINEQSGDWKDGISWDELQLIKNQCGFAGYDAVEVYPAEDKLTNDASLRHLWVFKDRVAFGL
jgi:hypothetical protein